MKFTKLQGTGNDFILIDARREERDWPDVARRMCPRRFGVGADGLLLLLSSAEADYRLRMFNPDGSEAEACGNGLRCFAKYVVDRGLAEGPELRVETLAGVRKAWVTKEGGVVSRVQVSMGEPRFAPEEVPVALPAAQGRRPLTCTLDVAGRKLTVACLSMGNPHAVSFLEEGVEEFPLHEVGPLVEHHALFPQRVNFEVVNVLGRGQVRARVWERGAGETLSCGSGACAIAVAARLHGLTGDKIDIMLPGGTLAIDWEGWGEVRLSGPVEEVFTAEWRSL